MKQVLVTIALLFSSYLSVSAQKEVFFNTAKPEDIKVVSMRGLEISSGYNPLTLFRSSSDNNNSFGIPLTMSYFSEKRIAPSWTLTTRIGLTHNFIKQAEYVNYPDSFAYHDSIYHYFNQKIDGYQFVYQLSLHLEIEPRWYFNFKNRYQKGHAKLNSGWFVSLPVSYNTLLINTYKWPESENSYHTNFKNYGSLNTLLLFGYRQAISKNWFLEANLPTIGYNFNFYKYTTGFYVYSNFVVNPMINLKASYTFK